MTFRGTPMCFVSPPRPGPMAFRRAFPTVPRASPWPPIGHREHAADQIQETELVGVHDPHTPFTLGSSA